MKSAVIAFLTCLLVFCVQGQRSHTLNKCKCSNGYISGRISPQQIEAGPVVHDPSVFCPRTEIIITIIGNKEKCVNPQSKLGQLILTNRNKNKQEKSRAVTMTEASSSTSVHTTVASSSTSVHTTEASSSTSVHTTEASSSTSVHTTEASSSTSVHMTVASTSSSLHTTPRL